MATHKPINILEAFAAAPPPLDYVLPNMVAGTVGALVSPGGAGKSMLALQLAAQIAGGPDLLEVGELPTGPVIYLPAEDPPTAIHHRLHALGAHLSAEERQAVADGLLIQPLIGSLPNIMAPEWFDGLKRAAEGRRLMVLDTLRRFHIEEENASGPMAQVIGRMEAIAADTGCSIVFLHHASKGAAMMGARLPKGERGRGRTSAFEVVLFSFVRSFFLKPLVHWNEKLVEVLKTAFQKVMDIFVKLEIL